MSDQFPSGLRSSQLARVSGVSSDTLRYYERHGLLPPAARNSNGYRQYPPEAVQQVRVIRSALAIGFTVEELGGIFRVRAQGGTPCRQVRALAAGKLAELERHSQHLKQVCARLRQALRQWDRKLGLTAKGRPAGLLTSLAAALPDSAITLSPWLAAGLRKKHQSSKANAKRRNTDEDSY